VSEQNEEEKLQAHIDTLLPVQQQAIAMAQLAGCEFRARWTERYLGHAGAFMPDTGYTGWAVTLEYTALLPDGTKLGVFEDVYLAACACLDELNGHNKPTELNPDLFRLAPGNEQP
jgi:hypothetical protein